MRLRVLAVLVAPLFASAGQYGPPSPAGAEPSLACVADFTAPSMCEATHARFIEREGAVACSESSGSPAPLASVAPLLLPTPLPVKQLDEWDSSAWEQAQDLGGPKVPKVVQEVAVVAPEPVGPKAPRYEFDDNHDVRRFLDQFQTGYRRAVIERWLVSAGRYLPMVLDVFRQKGLPEELVFTAMIESGFDPLAASRAGARGLWQFMAPTAKRYGLRIDRWMDERLDPEKSTVAAARHFVDLYSVFGSWNLAQAAYNAGERTVTDAIRAMGTSDFWALTRGRWLKDETKNFVPAIQAATIIAKEPERYGFVVTPAPPLAYDLVTVPRSTGLKELATKAGLEMEVLERLNPELRLKQTPPDVAYSLKVPIGAAVAIQSAIDRDTVALRSAVSRVAVPVAVARTNPPATPTRIHVVKARETVSVIAQRYGVSSADIARWNDLADVTRIRPGDRLRVTGPGAREEALASSR